MRVVFAGTPAVAVPSLEALLASDHEVVAVLTRPDAPVGRKKILTPSPVAQVAQQHGLPCLKTTVVDRTVIAELKQFAPDVIPVVAYGTIIPRQALDVAAHGWINVHFSLLPAWRGAAPVQHAILRGDDITGITIFQIEEGLDTGDVLSVSTHTVGAQETSGELLGRLAQSGAAQLVDTLTALQAGALVPAAQQGEVSLAPKISAREARISWQAPALAIHRLVRATNPEPGAWTELDGNRIKIHRTSLLDARQVSDGQQEEQLVPGQVSSADPTLVMTGSGLLRLESVQPAGRKETKATDWARGAHPGGAQFS